MSDQLWIYWVTTVPATIIIVVLWRIWLANSDAITRSTKEWLERARALWERRKLPRQHGSEKTGQP